MYEQIEKIIAYMEENISSTLRVEDIAQQFGYNKSYFSREFKKSTGLSPNEYISSLKIKNGIHSITQGESVIQAQLEASHQSSGTFSSTFKKSTGLSPRDYQHNMTDLYEMVKQQENLDKDSDSLYFRNPNYQVVSSPYYLEVQIDVPEQFTGVIFSGLFLKPIPNHLPAMGRCRVKKFVYKFYDLPDGTYYPLACGIPKSINVFNYFLLNKSMRACDGQSITFPLEKNETLLITLREVEPTDPPVTINLPNLLATAVKQQIQRNKEKVKKKIKKSKYKKF